MGSEVAVDLFIRVDAGLGHLHSRARDEHSSCKRD